MNPRIHGPFYPDWEKSQKERERMGMEVVMESQMDWQLKKKRLEGKYANYFRIGHTDDVFVFDYYQIFPENDDEESNPQLFDNPKDRIIISPSDAKQLLKQLKVAIEIYESDSKKFQD